MKKIVIEINGVRHVLVEDNVRWFDCHQCSLAEYCRIRELLLCNVFSNSYHHFEIRKD